MKNTDVYSIYGEADALLKFAQREINKAEEDVVPFLSCSNARMAMTKFMQGYLIKQGQEPPQNYTLQSLADTCANFNPIFKELKLHFMDCSQEDHNETYCTDINKVRECVKIAEETKNMVSRKTWPLSNPVK